MERGFKITAAQLEEVITPKSKVLIFSSPNNPCGAIYSKEDLAAIAAVVAKHPNLYIISDEIYELLNYGEVKHISIASFPEVYDQNHHGQRIVEGICDDGMACWLHRCSGMDCKGMYKISK